MINPTIKENCNWIHSSQSNNTSDTFNLKEIMRLAKLKQKIDEKLYLVYKINNS